MIGSHRDKSFIGERDPVTYTLNENSVVIRETGYTEHVLIPDYLTADIESRSGEFGGVVVSDLLFQRIARCIRFVLSCHLASNFVAATFSGLFTECSW